MEFEHILLPKNKNAVDEFKSYHFELTEQNKNNVPIDAGIDKLKYLADILKK